MKGNDARPEMGRRHKVLLDFVEFFRGPDLQAAGGFGAIPFHFAGNVVDDKPAEAVGHHQRKAVIGEGAGRLVHPLARAGGRDQFLAVILVCLVGDQFHVVAGSKTGVRMRFQRMSG